MGELRAARDVADRRKARRLVVRSRASTVDALGAHLDARRREVERLDVRPPAGRDQQMRAVDPLAAGEHGSTTPSPSRSIGARSPTRARSATPSAASRSAEQADQLGIVARQHRAGIEHRDPAPSRRCACASSMPIGPPPITIRCSGSVAVGEHRLVGEIGHAIEARDRRHRRRRAGGDDEPPRPDRCVAGAGSCGLGKPRLGARSP